MNSAKIPLSMVQVASPCTASWHAMAGDDRTRFCGQCSQYVYNLSELTEADAEALVAEHEGKMRVRYYQRFDGTIMTKDCPVAWRGLKRRIAIAGGVTIAVCMAMLSFITLGVFAAGAEPGRRIPNPIEVIHDLIFPRAVAGGLCPPAPPAGGGQPPVAPPNDIGKK